MTADRSDTEFSGETFSLFKSPVYLDWAGVGESQRLREYLI